MKRRQTKQVSNANEGPQYKHHLGSARRRRSHSRQLRFFIRWTLTLYFLIAFTVQLLYVPLSLRRPPSFQIGPSNFAIAQWTNQGINQEINEQTHEQANQESNELESRSYGYSLTINLGPLGAISAIAAGILTLTKFTQRKQA